MQTYIRKIIQHNQVDFIPEYSDVQHTQVNKRQQLDADNQQGPTCPQGLREDIATCMRHLQPTP